MRSLCLALFLVVAAAGPVPKKPHFDFDLPSYRSHEPRLLTLAPRNGRFFTDTWTVVLAESDDFPDAVAFYLDEMEKQGFRKQGSRTVGKGQVVTLRNEEKHLAATLRAVYGSRTIAVSISPLDTK